MPVREGATLSLRSDGNLIPTDTDGSTAWQTGTAKMGVVGLELLPNGNFVLRDAENHVVWKSFDYPTDTFLMGQCLKPNAPNMLQSGEEYSSTGRFSGRCYSFKLMKQRSYFSLVTQVLSNDKYSRKPLIYFKDDTMLDTENTTLLYVSLNSVPLTVEAHSFTVGLALSSSKRASISLTPYKSIQPRPNTTTHIQLFEWNSTVILTSTHTTNTTLSLWTHGK